MYYYNNNNKNMKNKNKKNKSLNKHKFSDNSSENLSIDDNNSEINNKADFDINKIYFDINSCLENYKFCKITGEIITFKISDNNAWINIKFINFQITGIFWKISFNKNFENYKLIKSGDKMIFEGNFNIFKKNLNIYFNIKNMIKDGKGDYLDLYEKSRIKIKELNHNVEKKKIIKIPYLIGIITSIEGAAIHDILQTLKLDKFFGNVIIKNSIVQGTQCPKSIISSIEWFEEHYSNNIDLLMITRGGGSHEDLIGFSDWDLLLKILSTKFITISAVGHQIDNQLIDEVADYKFATPSIGAKFIVETQTKYKELFFEYKKSLNNIYKSYIDLKNKFSFITKNYLNILNKYDMENIISKNKKYFNILNNLLLKYSYLKNLFYTQLDNLRPKIIRTNELVSINDFINIKKNKEIKPKKIEIYFIDGMVIISYKIIHYEQYKFK